MEPRGTLNPSIPRAEHDDVSQRVFKTLSPPMNLLPLAHEKNTFAPTKPSSMLLPSVERNCRPPRNRSVAGEKDSMAGAG
jgi:hypothetical protein